MGQLNENLLRYHSSLMKLMFPRTFVVIFYVYIKHKHYTCSSFAIQLNSVLSQCCLITFFFSVEFFLHVVHCNEFFAFLIDVYLLQTHLYCYKANPTADTMHSHRLLSLYFIKYATL
jgi:hypothetical protein